jgi:hypothetical protein
VGGDVSLYQFAPEPAFYKTKVLFVFWLTIQLVMGAKFCFISGYTRCWCSIELASFKAGSPREAKFYFFSGFEAGVSIGGRQKISQQSSCFLA